MIQQRRQQQQLNWGKKAGKERGTSTTISQMMFVCSSLLVLFHFCLPNSLLLLKEGKVGIVKKWDINQSAVSRCVCVCVCGWLAS